MINPDVIAICRDLIRINTSNPTHSENEAAEYVSAYLDALGIVPTVYAAHPGRTSVMARIRGHNHHRPPLLVHAHLDVVPADEAEWSVDPFGGEERDGSIWGRGALDMKGMIAAVLACLGRMVQSGHRPRRDLILAFFADEEAGGRLGAGYVTREHPEAFAGCREAIGEVGGFSFAVPHQRERRLYLIGAAEKGVKWMKLECTGTPGHGSLLHVDNPVVSLCDAVGRIATHPFPVKVTPTVQLLLKEAADWLDMDPEPVEPVVRRLGPLARLIGASMRDTANPTILEAGYKINVVPGRAEAAIDGRFLPGNEEVFEKTLHGLLGPESNLTTIYTAPALEAPWDVPITEAMTGAILGEDPLGRVVPHMTSAFTDAKWLAPLDITSYGFTPLRLPVDFDFTALFHGVDERVPIESLQFSVAVLSRFLLAY